MYQQRRFLLLAAFLLATNCPVLAQTTSNTISVQADTAQYYYAVDGAQAGPVSLEQIHGLVEDGTITPSTLVWTDGLANWQSADTVDAVSALFAVQDPVSPPAEEVGSSADPVLYYYVQDGAEAGPVPAEDLRSLVESGAITRTTFVWTYGLESWVEAETVDVFTPIFPPSIPPEIVYYIARNDQQIGPLSLDDLRGRIQDFSLKGSDLVWKPGLETWTPALSLDELADAFISPPPLTEASSPVPGDDDPEIAISGWAANAFAELRS
jgi:hypothetical protein